MDPSLTSPDAVPLWPFGARDFVQYWSAFHLLMQGHNPYDSLQMLGIQESIGFPGELPVLMWNPPWLLMLLAPILWISFDGATTAWCVLNVLMLGSIPFLVGGGAREPLSRGRFMFLAILTLLFFPALDSIRSGQLGVFLAFGVALIIRGLKTEKAWMAGLGLALLSVKPHLAAMVGVAALMRVGSEKAVRGMLVCAITWLGILVATIVLWRQELLAYWIGSLFVRPVIGVPLMEWRTDTLTSFLREMFLAYADATAGYLVVVVPILFVVGLCVLAVRVPGLRAVALVQVAVVLAPVFAPYGWVSDYAIALPSLLALFCSAPAPKFGKAALMYFGAGLVSMPFFFGRSSLHAYVFMFPLLLMPAVALLLFSPEEGER
jgi:hypothetical protein